MSQHCRQDQLIRVVEIDRVIAELEAERGRAIRFEVLSSEGKPIRIEIGFAIGRSGGLAEGIERLRKLKGM